MPSWSSFLPASTARWREICREFGKGRGALTAELARSAAITTGMACPEPATSPGQAGLSRLEAVRTAAWRRETAGGMIVTLRVTRHRPPASIFPGETPA